MSNSSRKALRLNALVLAMAGIVGSGLAADASAQVRTSRSQIEGVNYGALVNSPTFERFIVKFRDTGASARAAEAAAFAAIDNAARSSGLQLNHVRRLATGAELIEVSGKALGAADSVKLMETFARAGDVEYIEPDQRMYALVTPNDTRYNEQWDLYEATGGMRMPTAWDVATGSGVTVAVIDTGITPHADLSANIVAGYDFVSSSANARDGNGRDSNPNDEGDWYGANECGSGIPASNSSWHGTHVAGTIAAVTNNASGVAGVAYGAKVQPVRVLAKCGGTLADIADAIVWASGGTVSGVAANPTPAKVINMSLGGGGACASTYQSAITSAVNRGTVVVVAAGNSNANASGFQPASCNNVINVAALGRTGSRAYYSNYGSIIDVAAPGGDVSGGSSGGILSTLNSGTTTQGSATYAFYQGTSMAAPHVAALAALILEKQPSATPAQVEAYIKNNVRAIPGSGCTVGCGTGLVDATATLNAVTGGPPPGGPTVLTNGVAQTGQSGATGSDKFYTLAVPAGATNLKFVTTGGSGDADLYVRFGSAPTTTTYDCKSEGGTNAETCNIATAQAGTYHVLVRGYAAYSGLSITGSYTAGGGGGTSFFENLTDYAVPDLGTAESPITVSGRTGNAPSNLSVAVNIVHTYVGDLRVDLVAPDGSVYNLRNRTGGSADNIVQTFSVNASSEVANGTWKLRVQDAASQDTGYINSWSLQF